MYKPVIQAGALATRTTAQGLEIALVTSKRGTHWVIPKGHWEPPEALTETARREALEEAGLKGTVAPQPLGSYRYQKRGQSYQVYVYHLRVEETLSSWPEQEKRHREWVDKVEASRRIPAVRDLIGCLEND